MEPPNTAKQYRYFVRSPDGRAIIGFDNMEGARTAALAYDDGCFVIDTHAKAYLPMLQETMDGDLVYAGYGGWDTGRFGLDRDFVESIKKGHVAIVHAFLAKGAQVNARDHHGGPALHWAVGGGKPEIVKLLLDQGADVTARDSQGQTAFQVADARGRSEIAELLKQAGAEA
jgi:hypothetical protein